MQERKFHTVNCPNIPLCRAAQTVHNILQMLDHFQNSESVLGEGEGGGHERETVNRPNSLIQ